MTRISILLLLLLVAGYGVPAGSKEPDVSRARALALRVFAAVNDQRVSRGLPALIWSERLADPARRHSERMALRNFFSHEDPDFGDPAERLNRAGIAWRACGENIYQESGRGDPVRSSIQAWLGSAGHRANLLGKNYTHTGIGVAIGPGGMFTISELFAAF